MKQKALRWRIFPSWMVTVVLVAAVGTLGVSVFAESARKRAYSLADNGALVRPTGYRSWIYVGTPVTPNDMNNGKAAFPEHHNVYIDPDSYAHYTRTGKWREGTILVKELVSVGSKQAVSGNGYFQGEFIGLEATIKSARDFPGEPGNWAYYSFTNEEELGGRLKDAAAPFPSASCNACHEASAQDDFVFTQYYPVLRSAKGAKSAPEDGPDRPKTLPASSSSGDRRSSVTFDQDGREPEWSATVETPSAVDGTDVPTLQQDLFDYLQQGSYRSWDAKETAPHPSRGPHVSFGKPVLTYLNETLASSMRAGSASHPVGATAIKEMFDDGGELIGWAVEIKTRDDSAAGDGWFWYEVTSTTDGSTPVAIGNGVPGCVECHSQRGNSDLVRTSWPLR